MFFFFYFGSCGKLSWLNWQLSSSRRYSIFTYLFTYLQQDTQVTNYWLVTNSNVIVDLQQAIRGGSSYLLCLIILSRNTWNWLSNFQSSILSVILSTLFNLILSFPHVPRGFKVGYWHDSCCCCCFFKFCLCVCVLICTSTDFSCCMLLVYYLSVIVCFLLCKTVSVKNGWPAR